MFHAYRVPYRQVRMRLIRHARTDNRSDRVDFHYVYRFRALAYADNRDDAGSLENREAFCNIELAEKISREKR